MTFPKLERASRRKEKRERWEFKVSFLITKKEKYLRNGERKIADAASVRRSKETSGGKCISDFQTFVVAGKTQVATNLTTTSISVIIRAFQGYYASPECNFFCLRW